MRPVPMAAVRRQPASIDPSKRYFIYCTGCRRLIMGPSSRDVSRRVNRGHWEIDDEGQPYCCKCWQKLDASEIQIMKLQED